MGCIFDVISSLNAKFFQQKRQIICIQNLRSHVFDKARVSVNKNIARHHCTCINLFVTCKWRVYVYIDFYNKILSWCLLKNISLRKQTFLPTHCRNVCFHGLQKRAHQKHLFWFIIRIKKQSKWLKWSLMVCTCILAL